MQDDSELSDGVAGPEIKAPVSSWFYRRCLLLGVLLAGMGLYFCYDGFVGYPKQNRNADLYDAFLLGKEGKEEVSEALKKNPPVLLAYAAGKEGTSWAAHAATLHLPAEPPKRHSEADMATQKRIALVLGICAALVAIWAFVHRGRAWSMKGGEIRTPWDTRFSATSITDIDRRRWDRGIALLISNDRDRFLKLKLDDYKYQGAGQIIEAVAQLHPDARIDPPLSKAAQGSSRAAETVTDEAS